MQRIKLFCFPYAGGSSTIYHSWENFLGPDIKLMPVELAGRGSRIKERLYPDFEAMINDMFAVLKNNLLVDDEYAMFGHSLGGLIVYELIREIEKSEFNMPKHVFISGRAAPDPQSYHNDKIYLLDDHGFETAIKGFGGTPAEFFSSRQLLDLFIPILKNDFRLADRDYRGKGELSLKTDMSILVGKDDDIVESCETWPYFTKGSCRIHYFTGGHFYIREKTRDVVAVINETLLSKQ